MADLFGLTDVSSLTESGSAIAGSALSTGDLRRKYNFGDRVSELAIAQDPFFRFLSKVSKKPTDDHQFKFTERRPSYHKRYAYVTAHGSSRAGLATNDAEVTAAQAVYDAMSDEQKSEPHNIRPGPITLPYA